MRLTLDLPDSLSAELEERAQRAGVSVAEYVKSQLEGLTPKSGSDTHPLIALAERVRAEVAEDGVADYPKDFARNHDHYIHGALRQSE